MLPRQTQSAAICFTANTHTHKDSESSPTHAQRGQRDPHTHTHTHTLLLHTLIEITQSARGVLKEESNASSDADGQVAWEAPRQQRTGGKVRGLGAAWQLVTVDGGQNQNADEQANEKVVFSAAAAQAQKAKSKGGGNRQQDAVCCTHTQTIHTHTLTYEKSLRCAVSQQQVTKGHEKLKPPPPPLPSTLQGVSRRRIWEIRRKSYENWLAKVAQHSVRVCVRVCVPNCTNICAIYTDTYAGKCVCVCVPGKS